MLSLKRNIENQPELTAVFD